MSTPLMQVADLAVHFRRGTASRGRSTACRSSGAAARSSAWWASRAAASPRSRARCSGSCRGGRDGRHRRRRGEGRAALRALRRNVQMIFQDPYQTLNPRRRVGNIVAEALVVAGVPRAEHAARVERALDEVGMAPARFIGRYPHELSGGQRQRVAIAATLVLEPAGIICDEPVSMLDVSVRSQILHVLLELQRRARAGAAVHHPRPQPRVAAVRPDRGHVPRADRRAGRRARRDRAPRPPLHPGARRRGAAAQAAHAARRRAAGRRRTSRPAAASTRAARSASSPATATIRRCSPPASPATRRPACCSTP